MNDRLEKIKKALISEKLTDQQHYITGALSYIEKTANDPKRTIVDCHYPSIVDSVAKSIQLEIPIDGRGLAYLESRYDKHLRKKVCNFGIGYRAYFYKLSKTLTGFDGEAFCVYEGDEITTEDKDGFHSYTLKKQDVFASGAEKIRGVIVRLSYLVEGQPRQKLGIIGIDEILKIKSKAKHPGIWNEWFDEKSKAAGTRRACKGLFDISVGLQELVRYDNEKFEMDTPVEMSVTDSIDSVVSDKSEYISAEQILKINSLIFSFDQEEDLLDWMGVSFVEKIPADCYEAAIEYLEDKQNGN